MIIKNSEYWELQYAKKQAQKYQLLHDTLRDYLYSDKFKHNNMVNINDILLRMSEVQFAELDQVVEEIRINLEATPNRVRLKGFGDNIDRAEFD